MGTASMVRCLHRRTALLSHLHLHSRLGMQLHLQSKQCAASCQESRDPLAGIRVLDLTRIVAGPYCTMVLGDLGAEVIKVERPGEGDECRKWGPPFIGNTNESCYFVAMNRNKRSICVDMKSEEGKRILFDLAERSDVLVENYVPGKMDEMGLGYEDFKVAAPHLIYCSVTGFGPVGPYSKRPGYDVIAASIGGLLHITGPADGEPCKVGVALTDIMTGLYAHGAIMAALIQRGRTGLGQKIDANLLSTQVASLINIGSNYLNAGVEARRHGTSHPSIVPYEAFLAKDNTYITVGTGSDKQFVDLCCRFELPDLAKDRRFQSNKLRVENRKALLKILKDKFQTKTKKEWLQLLDGASFPYGPVNNIADEPPAVRLKLRKPKSDKKVKWDADTVDNEHMNKRKSKCCCIYKKHRAFDESSSSESEDECENCFGHVEHRKKGQTGPEAPQPSSPVPCGSGTASVPESPSHSSSSHDHAEELPGSSTSRTTSVKFLDSEGQENNPIQSSDDEDHFKCVTEKPVVVSCSLTKIRQLMCAPGNLTF